MKTRRLYALLILAMVAVAGFVSAHEEVAVDDSIRHTTGLLVIWGGLAVAALIGVASKAKSRKSRLPPFAAYALFISIVVVVVGVTAYVAGSTIYLNAISVTGGPVHWHADFEVWNCGQKVDMVDPRGLSNKVGSAVFHEHGDDRVHAEGVIVERHDASLGSFWKIAGGELRSGWLRVPTGSGEVTMKDGDQCSGKPGTLQVFIWKDVNGQAVQEKLSDYEDYVLSGHGQVPPGDCIILEFDEARERTERMCESYEVALRLGKIGASGEESQAIGSQGGVWSGG